MSGLRDWLVQKIGGEPNSPTQDPPAVAAPSPQVAPPAAEAAPSEEQLRLMRLSRFGATAAVPVEATPQPQEKRMKPSPAAAPAVLSSSPAAATTASSPAVAARSPATAAAAGASPVDVLADEDEWASETLALVLGAALPRDLPRLARELAQDGQRTDRLTAELTDRAMLELVARLPHPQTCSFLYGCFARARQQSEKVLNRRDPARMQVLAGASRAAAAFAALFAAFPGAFPGQPGRPERETSDQFGANQLAPLFAASADDVERTAFAAEVIRAAPDALLPALVRPLVLGLRRRVGPKLLLREEQREVLAVHRALGSLLALPRAGAAAAALSEWLPATGVSTGRELQRASLLGPFFAVSSFPDEPHVGDALLLNKTTREEIFPVFDRLRNRFGLLQASLTQSLLSLLKAKPSRAAVTAWLIAAVNLNAGRTHMRPDWDRCSTHGFLLNLGAVCIALCEPIAPKLHTVDPNYCVLNVRGVEFGGTTRLACDDRQVAARAQALQSAPPGEPVTFNTEIFWITARALSVGMRPAAAAYNALYNVLGEREGQLEQLEQLEGAQRQAAGLRTAVAVTRKDKLAAEAHIKHPEMLMAVCRFYDMAARWFTISADPEKRGTWPAEPRPEVACVPQWLVDDMIFFYEWLAHHAVDILQLGVHHQNLLSFLALLFSSERYVASPHLRGRLVDLLQILLPNKNNGLPPDAFEKNKFVGRLLIPALVRFYIDCEKTGGNNQFYDKFSIRYRIGDVIEHLWNSSSSDLFRRALVAECANQPLFQRFVTLLGNDATFLLDEAVHKLEEIHELERLRESPAQWGALSSEQQEEKTEQLGQLTRATRSYNLLAMSSIRLFRNLSTEVVDPFMSPELVDRLASMLDYFLVQLAGPKCAELKVRNPQAVSFDPRLLLRTLCAIYVNLGARPEFLAAIARDERSYRQEVFVTVCQILRHRIAGVAESEAAAFEAFVARLEASARELVEDEPWSDSEVPDEFQDPIMSTLMRDPVTWEGSHVTCDRAVITRQLLNEPIDPYTRRPLTAAQLVSVPDLKRRIDDWVTQQRAAKKP